MPLGATGTVGARFSTSEDVYWFAATADSAELAAACGLHALAPHYPNALRRFFVTLLHVPERPNPSTSRLLEAIHTLAASPPTESTARVVAECQRVCSRRSNRAELSPPSTGAHPPPPPWPLLSCSRSVTCLGSRRSRARSATAVRGTAPAAATPRVTRWASSSARAPLCAASRAAAAAA